MKKGDNIATRNAYGKTLVELGEKDERIVVLDADLAKSTKTGDFKKKFPERFFDIGISEADMMGTAAGLSLSGKIPFASTFAIFAAGKAFEQIRNSIAYPILNVKIVATHAGVTVGEDGGSHQAIEDLSLMRTVPNMTVMAPVDGIETRKAIIAIRDYKGPVYMRLSRSNTLVVTDDNTPFEIGKGICLKEGKDVAIFSTGITGPEALKASEILATKGIEAGVYHFHTLKPFDELLAVECAKKYPVIFTLEEHSVIGGLGSAVCETLCNKYPKRVIRLGLQDVFGQSGTSEALMEEYRLTGALVAEDVERILGEITL